MPTNHRRRRLRVWALGVLPLAAVAVVVAVVVTRNRIDGPPGGTAPDRPGTVLLVAGYGGSTRALDVLDRDLRALGRTVVVVPPVGDNTGDLVEQSRALDRSARAAVRAGSPSVDVVGYSAGGVVTRIWVEQLGGAAVARRVVTLGSPHHGTDVAGLAAALLTRQCPEACRQLAPDSDLLSGLAPVADRPRWTSVWTANDDLVVPPSSAALEGAVDVQLQQVCADARVGHGDLPRDPLTIGIVERALTGPAPAGPPAPADCARLRLAGTPS